MTALTPFDAFFVAYQERSGIAMHFGAEIELRGPVARPALDAAVAHALVRWPALGQTLRRGVVGLRWTGAPDPERVLRSIDDAGAVARWRNTTIDPFAEPPFQVLWVPTAGTLAFRSHHAVADGLLFFAIVVEILTCLAGGAPSPAPAATPHPLGFGRLWRQRRLGSMWRHTRWLAREARGTRAARLALRAVACGDIGTVERTLDAAAARALASRSRSGAPWQVAAAWLRALHAWNLGRGAGTNPTLSLEVPVSLRRGPNGFDGTGNRLSALTLFADASQPLDELARHLARTFADGVRRRDHLAVPLFSAPARLLPWSLFRRVAVTPASTGFATSHFTWLAHPSDGPAAVAAASGGALAVVAQHLYTPVCLHMGAALSVLVLPDALQLTVTHRTNGLAPDDAHALADHMLVELG